MIAEDVTRLVGPKGRHNPDRAAVRHGAEPGQVTLGGRRVRARRVLLRKHPPRRGPGAPWPRGHREAHFTSWISLGRQVLSKKDASGL